MRKKIKKMLDRITALEKEVNQFPEQLTKVALGVEIPQRLSVSKEYIRRMASYRRIGDGADSSDWDATFWRYKHSLVDGKKLCSIYVLQCEEGVALDTSTIYQMPAFIQYEHKAVFTPEDIKKSEIYIPKTNREPVKQERCDQENPGFMYWDKGHMYWDNANIFDENGVYYIEIQVTGYNTPCVTTSCKSIFHQINAGDHLRLSGLEGVVTRKWVSL